MSESRRWTGPTPEEAVEMLADADLLTERQAEAFVHRDVECVPRQATADEMGISVNTLDKRLREARDKVEAAEATSEALDDIRNPPIPSECAECGETLGGRFAENGDGEPVCLDCGDIADTDT